MGNVECTRGPQGLMCMVNCKSCNGGLKCQAHSGEQRTVDWQSDNNLFNEEWPHIDYQAMIDIASKAIIEN